MPSEIIFARIVSSIDANGIKARVGSRIYPSSSVPRDYVTLQDSIRRVIKVASRFGRDALAVFSGFLASCRSSGVYARHGTVSLSLLLIPEPDRCPYPSSYLLEQYLDCQIYLTYWLVCCIAKLLTKERDANSHQSG